MSLTQALSAAVSGLRATQTGLSVVAGNVSNADTPGYIRKSPTRVSIAAGDAGIGVRVASIDRQLDVYVQRQLRTESSGGAYADLRADFYRRLQKVYGDPGSDGSLETEFNKFIGALQALITSPDSSAIRSSVLGTAQVLTQQLNGMSEQLQALRTDAELGLDDAVRQANEAMQQIAHINQQLGRLDANDATAAILLDQRDRYVDQLAELMDVRVVTTNRNQVSVFTTSGIQLVGTEPSQLTFDNHGTLTARAEWNDDAGLRTVGTITLISPNGGSSDLLATRALRSGKIATYVEMRDQILPQAQAQLDQIAAAMASALSDRTVDGTPVTGPPPAFDVGTGNLLAGNRINVTYTDAGTGAQHTVTIIRVDDPAVLPLADSATAAAGDKVVGVDFSGGMVSVVAQLNSALGSSHLQFSNPGGSTLRVLADSSNAIALAGASTTATVTSLTGGTAELPFFLDALSPYSGAITQGGLQVTGLSGRIAVNPALIADPSRLVVYQTSPLTPAGDLTRPNFIYDQLTRAPRDFSADAGIGTLSSPFNGSVPSYVRQMLSLQGQAAASAESLQQGQDLVVKSLQQRFTDQSGVNVDMEMAMLLQLQSAYAASARIMATVRDLQDILLKM